MHHNGIRSQYIYGADILRLIAALLVALFHLTWMHAGTATIAWYGWIGVQIFFVISGFVIARSANDTTPMRFAEARFLRLYPGTWICAVVSFLVIVFHRGLAGVGMGLIGRLATSLTLFPTGPFIASAYWTLPIEMAFYLLVFVILIGGQFHHLQRVANGLCLLSSLYIVAYCCQSAGLVHQPALEFGYGWKNISLLRHGIYFAFGIYLWLWSEGLLGRSGRAALLLCTVMAPLEITCRSAELLALSPAHMSLAHAWAIPVAIWLAACMMLTASTYWRVAICRLPPRLLWGIRVAGLATYPLYLIHEDLGSEIRDALVRFGCSYLASACIAIAAIVAVAIVIAHIAEPALRGWLRTMLHGIGNGAVMQRRFRRLNVSGGVL